MLTEDFVSLTPVDFFQIKADCHYLEHKHHFNLNEKNEKSYRLPDLSDLCDEEHFAEVALAWSLEGLELYLTVNGALENSFYPELTSGDSFELFVDTRDVKTSGFNTRFCHHFFFLPQKVNERLAGEITHFRTEDSHELCDPNELKVKTYPENEGYAMQIFIPASCLHGYDPDQFSRLGLTYRVNSTRGDSQHFSVTSNDYQIDQQPSLWSSIGLIR